MKKIIFKLTLLGITLSLPLTASAGLKDWYLYQSENMEVYSDQRNRKVKNALGNLEVFHDIALKILNLPSDAKSPRLKILMYSQNAELYKLTDDRNIAGFFVETFDGPRMIAGDASSLKNSEILLHEYVHHLMGSFSTYNYPRWYNEGIAYYLQTAEAKNNRFRVGRVPETMLTFLDDFGTLEIQELLGHGEGVGYVNKETDLYSYKYLCSSWLLIHAMITSQLQGDTTLAQPVNAYIVAINNGESPGEAYKNHVAESAEKINGQLRSYRKQQAFKVVDFKVQEYQGKISRKKLSEAERAYLLADTAFRVGKEASALEYLDSLGDDITEYSHSLALSAVLKNHKGYSAEIENLYQQALSEGSENAETLTLLSHLNWDIYNEKVKQGEDGNDWLDKSIELGHKSVELDPTSIEPHRFLYFAYSARENTPESLRSLMQIHTGDPGNLSINLEIGKLLKNNGEGELSRPFLLRVANRSHSEKQRNEALQLLGVEHNSENEDK